MDVVCNSRRVDWQYSVNWCRHDRQLVLLVKVIFASAIVLGNAIAFGSANAAEESDLIWGILGANATVIGVTAGIGMIVVAETRGFHHVSAVCRRDSA